MKISILMPCYNEEKTIEKTLLSCLNQSVKADQIIVVNDGSKDNTLDILKKYEGRIEIIDLKKNTGNKSLAQKEGMKFVTGDVFVTCDGDTLLDIDFIKNALAYLEEHPNMTAVSGHVSSLPNNWLTAARGMEYVISQDVHKNAQNIMGYIYVLPGCATIFNTKIFNELISFDHDTLTEDLDFTFQIQMKGGKLGYTEKAIVYTQDPGDLPSYIKQMRRWHSGSWQNLQKHISILGKNPMASLEISMSFFEGLIGFLLLFGMLLLNPVFFFVYTVPVIYVYIFIMAVYASWRTKRIDFLYYWPFYFFIMLLNQTLFIWTFIQEVILRKKMTVWLKANRVSI